MGFTVKVNHPHFPEGTIFNVGGLDRVPNGGSLEVDEEMERLFIMSQGQTVDAAFSGDHAIDVTGSSALDQSEVTDLLAAYAPAEEEAPSVVEEEVTDLATNPQTSAGNWGGGSTTDDEDGES